MKAVLVCFVVLLLGSAAANEPVEYDAESVAAFVAEVLEGKVVIIYQGVAVLETELYAVDVLEILEDLHIDYVPELQFRVEAQGKNIYLTYKGNRLERKVRSSRSGPQVRNAPSTPRNGCVSNSTSRSNTTYCYSNGRLTYQSICTIDSRYNVSCRSNTY